MIRIVFFGTPRFAAEILHYLLAQGVAIVGIVTQPDRPKGRALQTVPSAVKQVAPAEIPLLQPLKASEESFLEALRTLRADLFVVVAYGQILSQKLLAIPLLGCINVHASLLPKYRGAAPIQRCLMAGEVETGIAIQKMVKELDAGDVIASQAMAIPEDMTAGELEEKLCALAKPLLDEVIKKFELGAPAATPQDPTHVTYASKIELEEGELDWKQPARALHNLIRAFSPRPGAWAWIQSGSMRKRLKILKSRLASGPGPAVVACGEGFLELLSVQPEGKKIMTGADWQRGAGKSINFL